MIASSVLRCTMRRTIAVAAARTPALIRPIHTARSTSFVHTHMQRSSNTTEPAATSSSTVGGCGGSGACPCSTPGTPWKIKIDDDSSTSESTAGAASSTGGCGTAGCACAKAAQADAAESERRQSELSAMQAEVGQLYKLGQYEDAMEVAERARASATELFGPDHPATASTLNNLALLQRVHRQDYEAAAGLYQLALQAYKQSVGEKHNSYLTCLNNLALTYRSMGDLARAHSTLQSVNEFYTSTLDTQALKTSLPYAHAQMNLAQVVRDRNITGEKERAGELFRTALKIVQRKYGDEHPLTATILNNLALTHKQQGDTQAALTLYQQALGIRTRNLPPKHPDILITLNNLAECLRSMGQEEKAQQVQQKMIDIMEAPEPTEPKQNGART